MAHAHAHLHVAARHPERTLVVFQLFTDAVRAGVEDGAFAPEIGVRIVVLSVLGSLNQTPEWLSSCRPRPVDEVARELADAMLNGGTLTPRSVSTSSLARQGPLAPTQRHAAVQEIASAVDRHRTSDRVTLPPLHDELPGGQVT